MPLGKTCGLGAHRLLLATGLENRRRLFAALPMALGQAASGNQILCVAAVAFLVIRASYEAAGHGAPQVLTEVFGRRPP